MPPAAFTPIAARLGDLTPTFAQFAVIFPSITGLAKLAAAFALLLTNFVAPVTVSLGRSCGDWKRRGDDRRG